MENTNKTDSDKIEDKDTRHAPSHKSAHHTCTYLIFNHTKKNDHICLLYTPCNIQHTHHVHHVYTIHNYICVTIYNSETIQK